MEINSIERVQVLIGRGKTQADKERIKKIVEEFAKNSRNPELLEKEISTIENAFNQADNGDQQYFSEEIIKAEGYLKNSLAIQAKKINPQNQETEKLIEIMKNGSDSQARIDAAKKLGEKADQRIIREFFEVFKDDKILGYRTVTEEELKNRYDLDEPNNKNPFLAPLAVRQHDYWLHTITIGSPPYPETIYRTNEYVKRALAEIIVKMGKPAIPIVLEILNNDNNRTAQCRAIDILKNMADKSLAPEFIRALKNKDWYIRQEAVEALTIIGDKSVAEQLLPLLNDKDRLVRLDTLRVLSSLKDQRAINPLVQNLKDKESSVREESAKALETFGWQPTSKEEKIFYLIAQENWKELKKIGVTAVPYLFEVLNYEDILPTLPKIGFETKEEKIAAILKSLESKNPQTCLLTIKALEKLGYEVKNSAPVPGLVVALENPDYLNYRLAAIEAINKIGPAAKEAVPALSKLLTEDSFGFSNVRYAIRSIGTAGVPGLISALESDNEEVRLNVINILFYLNEDGQNIQEATLPLIKLLGDKDFRVRENATHVLSVTAPAVKESLPELRKLLSDQNPEAREKAADVLSAFGSAAEEAVPDLIKLLTDENHRASSRAENALAAIGKEAVLPLIQTFTDPKIDSTNERILIKIGREAVPELSRALESNNSQVRYKAAHVLNEIGPVAEEAVPALIKLLELKSNELDDRMAQTNAIDLLAKIGVKALPDSKKLLRSENLEIRDRAAEVVGKIGPNAKDALPILTELLENKDVIYEPVISAFWKIGEESIPFLIQALKNNNPNVRANAAYILGEMKPTDKESILSLARLLEDDQPAVKGRAAEALVKICPQEKEVITVFIQVLGSKKPYARSNALGALRKVGPQALPFLIKALENKNQDIRTGAIEAIGDFGYSANHTLPLLINLLNDENSEVRLKTLETIRKVDYSLKKAVVQLINLLSDTDPQVRERTIETLGKIGPEAKEALPALKKISKENKNEVINRKIKETIQKIQRKDSWFKKIF